MDAILVTGGAGYIGSHTVKALCQSGYKVVVVDDLSAGHRESIGDAAFVRGDLRDTALLRRTIAGHEVTAVIHFAALASVGESVRSPTTYYSNNVGGTLALLEAMVQERVERFVFSSTCAVYGEPHETPILESHPKAPINAYGESKLVVERALPHYGRAYGLRSIALRYFNAAGADPDGELGEDHEPELHLIPRAIRAATGVGSLEVHGKDYPTPDGTCLRDYIHVTDLADAHLLALGRLTREPDLTTAYNLGNGRPYSVLEVLASVERALGRPVPYTIGPRREGDPRGPLREQPEGAVGAGLVAALSGADDHCRYRVSLASRPPTRLSHGVQV